MSRQTYQKGSLLLLSAVSFAFFLVAICLSSLKLAKFAVSLTVYAITVLWLLQKLNSDKHILTWATMAACLGGTIELTTLFLQAVLPNWQTTPLLISGRLAILLPTYLIALVFRLLLQGRSTATALRHALLWATGLAIFGCLPAIFLLTQINANHDILKLAHFIGLHAMQMMPVAFMLISKLTEDKVKQTRVIHTVGCFVLFIIAALTSTALSSSWIIIIFITLIALIAFAGCVRQKPKNPIPHYP